MTSIPKRASASVTHMGGLTLNTCVGQRVREMERELILKLEI